MCYHVSRVGMQITQLFCRNFVPIFMKVGSIKYFYIIVTLVLAVYVVSFEMIACSP